jgi:hypothetical protein
MGLASTAQVDLPHLSMFDAGLPMFCVSVILAFVEVKTLQLGCGTLFEQDLSYGGIVPSEEYFYMDSLTGIGAIRCCMMCHQKLPNCFGVLYNENQRKCKLLKRNLNMTNIAENTTEVQWGYYRKIRRMRGLYRNSSPCVSTFIGTSLSFSCIM